MNKKINDGSKFVLRFMATLVALAKIRLALLDLQPYSNDLYLSEMNYHPGIYSSSAFFVLLHVSLMCGLIWSSDFLVLAWLVVYSVTIPISSIMLGTNHDLPWLFGFSKYAATYVTPKLGLDYGFKPAVGLLLAFLDYAIVSTYFLYKNIFDHKDTALPVHMKQTKRTPSYVNSGKDVSLPVYQTLEQKGQETSYEKMKQFCGIRGNGSLKCDGDN